MLIQKRSFLHQFNYITQNYTDQIITVDTIAFKQESASFDLAPAHAGKAGARGRADAVKYRRVIAQSHDCIHSPARYGDRTWAISRA
ncbi:hypothetical protein F01_420504 [Burkholderia cenocepacia]|nr:hypothetical protein F01_420504 [Burkholderia cenocepacia]